MKNSTINTIERLGPWFHNLHLPGGIQTAPNHTLGNFPAFKWEKLKSAIPENLSGWKVLDVGCNAGFYSFELAKRGADVTGIDIDPHYLKQATWAASIFGLEHKVEFQEMQVYELAHTQVDYDLVWFMGVLYHLRYPMLALDIISLITKKMLVFQTMSMPGDEKEPVKDDYAIHQRQVLLKEEWPKMAFIEKKWAGDPTNWWIMNDACIKATLRSCGFKITANPLEETYICEPDELSPSSTKTWNISEYLCATGKEWKREAVKKVTGG